MRKRDYLNINKETVINLSVGNEEIRNVTAIRNGWFAADGFVLDFSPKTPNIIHSQLYSSLPDKEV